MHLPFGRLTLVTFVSIAVASATPPPAIGGPPDPSQTQAPSSAGRAETPAAQTPAIRPQAGNLKHVPAKQSELTALKKAGIPANDVVRAHAFLEREFTGRKERDRPTFRTVAVPLRTVADNASAVAASRRRADAAFMQRSVVRSTTSSPQMTTNRTQINPSPPATAQIGIVVFKDQLLPESGEVQAGTAVVISGRSLTVGGTPTVTLDLRTCGSYPLTVVQSNDSNIEATIPRVVGNALRMGGSLVVHSGPFDSSAISITYVPPLQEIYANINVGANQVASGGHATSDGGIGLVEGQTMQTSTGDTRSSCCSSFYGGKGGNNTDTFMARVQLLNGYKVVDFLSGPGRCMDDVYQTCQVILEKPVATPSGFLRAHRQNRNGHMYWNPDYSELVSVPPSRAEIPLEKAIDVSKAAGSSSPETVIQWSYNAGSFSDYSVMWDFVGPLGARAFPWESGVPVHGQASCAT